eukprot:UN05610
MAGSIPAYNWLDGKSMSREDTIKQMKKKLSDDFIQTWIVMTSFWTPMHAINYRFISPTWRVLFPSICQFASSTFLSFMQFGDLLGIFRKILKSRNREIELSNKTVG